MKSGQSVGAVARELGLVDQTLRYWVKVAERGKLNPPGAKLVTPEQKRGGTPNRKRLTDAQMLMLIRSVHAGFKGAYGSPRMALEIRGRGSPASKARVERLMRENGIRARHKRRFKATADSKHSLPVAPNLLDRNFTGRRTSRLTCSTVKLSAGRGNRA